jgi:hypothetical protein
MNANSELLVGLSVAELEALTDSLLAPAAQQRLDELISRRKQKQLTTSEEASLDSILNQVDHLTILKARALVTLEQQRTEAAER